MGESHWDETPGEIDREKVRQMGQEYRYITQNYDILTTRLADITVYDLLQILDELEGARERARW